MSREQHRAQSREVLTFARACVLGCVEVEGGYVFCDQHLAYRRETGDRLTPLAFSSISAFPAPTASLMLTTLNNSYYLDVGIWVRLFRMWSD